MEMVAPSASAAPRWAPESKATIHPGVRTFSSGIGCGNRASFVFYDAHAVYLGQPARCSGSPGARGRIEGATRAGKIVYNSRSTMELQGEGYGATSRFNDFALVKVHDADEGRVNPSMPFWGGPAAGEGRSSFGTRVHSFGSPASYCYEDNCRPAVSVNQLVPSIGTDTTSDLMPTVPWGGLRPDGDTAGWVHYIHTVALGISVERGSAVLDSRGRALGIVGWPAYDLADRVTDLSKALHYMRAKTNLDAIRLASGTTRFAPTSAEG